MNKEKLIPKLRFEGFENNEWIPHKLKNIVRFSKGRGYSKNDLLEQGSPIILYGRMYTNYEIIIHNVDTYAKPKENTIYSEGTEVIVPSSGETAEDIARASFVSKKGIILGGDLNIMHLIEEHNPFFLALSISNGDRKKELIRRAQGSSVVHLYNTDLENAVVYFPTLTEQNKIGCFLKKIDEMIRLQQLKVNKVKDIKSAYLSEMFPKEGEKYPKRRFEGFTEPWTTKKLGSLLDYEQPTNYIVNSDSYDDSYLTPVLTAGKSFLLGYTNETEGIYKADDNNGVIIFDDFTTSSHFVDFDFKVKSSAMKFLRTNQSNFNLYFLYNLLISINYSPESHERHWISIFSEIEVLVPTKKEQQKIAYLFKNLDNQISIEEQKLAKLEKLKQAYLNDMFV